MQKARDFSKKGQSLRGLIATLLRSRYGSNAVVEEERISGQKAADIVFVPNDLPGIRRKIAVECKNWEKPLQAQDVRKIYSEYLPAHTNGAIQSLYIIAPHDISASVRATVADFYWVTFLTFNQFQAEIVDFSGYLAFLEKDFTRDSLSDYYVPSRLGEEEKGELLHDDVVKPWLQKEEGEPIAIVAGYGMGKTTYSRFLAHELATKALKDPQARIPILLPLGAVAQQQNIRSLISFLFADQYRVPGYTYHLFDVLNDSGRFVMIFDAFDEMKHAMSITDIKFNLEEIKGLIRPRSKAMLIGRPDPFLSDDQFKLLSGREKIIGRLAPSNRLANFKILYLDYFNNADITTFMRAYMNCILSSASPRPKNINSFIDNRLKSFNSAGYYELARRPVQARMIAELLCNLETAPQQSGIFHLYEHFVEYVIARETKKAARARVSDPQRLGFLRSVAWWLWVEKDDAHFTYLELPEELIRSVTGHRGAMAESLVREMLVGSLLDRHLPGLLQEKGSDYFYFAHKSYWEFLVCDYLLKSKLSDREVKLISTRITPQLIEFLSSAKTELTTNLYERLVITEAPANIYLYELAAKSPAAPYSYEHDDHTVTSNRMIISCVVARRNQASLEYKNWEEYYFGVEKNGTNNFCGMIFGLLYWAATDDDQRSRIIAALCALCACAAAKWVEKVERQQERRILYSEIDSEKEAGLLAFFESIELLDKNGVVLNCDVLARILIDRNLVNVEDTTFNLRMDNEQISPDQFDLLHEYAKGINFLRVLQQANLKYLELKDVKLDEIEDDELADD